MPGERAWSPVVEEGLCMMGERDYNCLLAVSSVIYNAKVPNGINFLQFVTSQLTAEQILVPPQSLLQN